MGKHQVLQLARVGDVRADDIDSQSTRQIESRQSFRRWWQNKFAHRRTQAYAQTHTGTETIPTFGYSANQFQFWLHVLLACMIGTSLRLTIFPEATLAEELGGGFYSSQTAFLCTFGLTKAVCNLAVGVASDHTAVGRRRCQLAGWMCGVVLALVLVAAKRWWQFVLANTLLGAQQGLAWTSNIFMLMDIMGPTNRSMGSAASNAAGYIFSALASFLAEALYVESGKSSSSSSGSDSNANHVFFATLLVSSLALALALFCVRDTMSFVEAEAGVKRSKTNSERKNMNDSSSGGSGTRSVPWVGTADQNALSPHHNENNEDSAEDAEYHFHENDVSWTCVFYATSFKQPSTRAICVAGLCANLVTALAWGLVLIWGKRQGLRVSQLAQISFGFTASKAFSMLVGAFVADSGGRKRVLLVGFSVAAVGLLITALADVDALTSKSSATTIMTSSRTGSNASTSAPSFAPSSAGDTGATSNVYYLLFAGGIAIGVGIGSVYPVLAAAIADHSQPRVRATAIGSYKLWRDSGYAIGGILTGVLEDATGSFVATNLIVAALVLSIVALLKGQYVENYKDKS